MITGNASLAISPRSATRATTIPAANTTRRPTRSEAALAGKATRAPATEAIVATIPIVAVDSFSDDR